MLNIGLQKTFSLKEEEEEGGGKILIRFGFITISAFSTGFEMKKSTNQTTISKLQLIKTFFEL